MGDEVSIRTEMLAALAHVACADETRAHIACVVFRPDEAVATNGHIIVRAQHRWHGLTAAFGVPRAACFAAVAAQDAFARHHSDYAMTLGVDLEAGTDGDSVVMETPHGNRRLTIRPADRTAYIDIADNIVLRTPTVDMSTFPDVDGAMASAGGRIGDPNDMAFDTRYIDMLDIFARASGYFARGVQCKRWDVKGAMEWVIPHDATDDDDIIRIVVMRMMRREDVAELRGQPRRRRRL